MMNCNKLWAFVGVVLVVVLVSSVSATTDSNDGVDSKALNALLPVVSRNGGVVNGTISVDFSPSCFLLSAQFLDSNKTPAKVQQLTINAFFYNLDNPEELDSNLMLSLSPNLTPTPYNTPYVSRRNELSLTVYDQLEWTGGGRICLYIHNAPSDGDESTELSFGISVQAIYLTAPESVHNSTIIANFQPGECQFYHVLPPTKNPTAGIGSVISLSVLSDNPSIAINISSEITGPSPYYQSNVTMIFYPPTNTTISQGYYLSIWNTDHRQEAEATVIIYWSVVQPKELVLDEDYTEAQGGWNYFYIALPSHKTVKHSDHIQVPAVTLSAAFTSVPSSEIVYFDVYTSTDGVANKGNYSFYFTTKLQPDYEVPDMQFPIADKIGDKVFVSIYVPETAVFTSLTATYGHKNYTLVANTTSTIAPGSGYFEIPKEQDGHYWVASFTCSSYAYYSPSNYFLFNLDNPSQCISSQTASQCYSSTLQIISPTNGLWFFDLGANVYCYSYQLNIVPRVYYVLNQSDTSTFYPESATPVVAVYNPGTFLQQVTLKIRNYNGYVYIGPGHDNLLHVLSTLPSVTSLPDGWLSFSAYNYYARPTIVFNDVQPEPIYVVFPATANYYYNLIYVEVYSAATIGTAICNDIKIQSVENGWKFYRAPVINPSSSLTVTLTLSNIGDANLWINTGVGTAVIPSPNNVTISDRSTNSVKTLTISNTGYQDSWNSIIGVNTTSIARYTLSACVTENGNNQITPIPVTVSSVYGSKVYYYDVTESQIQRGIDTMLFQVRSSSTYYITRVYVKYGSIPTGYDNDYNVSTNAAQMILINPLRSGRYYIKFDASYYTYYNVTLTASKDILLPIADNSFVNASIPTLGFKIYKFTVTNNDDPLQVNIPYASLPSTGYNFNVVVQHSTIPSSYDGEYFAAIPINTFLPTYAFTIERPHLGDWYVMTYGSGEVVLQVDYSGYTIKPKNNNNKKRETKSQKDKKINKVKLTAN